MIHEIRKTDPTFMGICEANTLQMISSVQKKKFTDQQKAVVFREARRLPCNFALLQTRRESKRAWKFFFK